MGFKTSDRISPVAWELLANLTDRKGSGAQMFDVRKNRIQAINYNIFLESLGYSLPKLRQHQDIWNRFIFIDSLLADFGGLAAAVGRSPEEIEQISSRVISTFQRSTLDFSITTINDDAYPASLRKLSKPPLMIFSRGVIEYANDPCVSVVGSRVASEEGRRRAQKLAILLAQNGYTVVSGLAAGIDTAAQTAIVKAGGKTIGVIGTPIDQCYPKENITLQEKIATGHLLISQFPLAQPTQKYNFPQRNYTMCGLSSATVIVEAGETSGALYQARYCLQEGRKLFVMKSLLENKALTWPKTYVKRGAIVLENIEQLVSELKNFEIVPNAPDDQDRQLSLFA
ncbi:DNA-protecting protein DprA [Candidatus Obscuribacterales bacterium]|nr:DNA-protecting protein DprA [Candidatus Obscuribacterales bacterium]